MKERIDKILADKKLVSSRSQAKTLIEKGDVFVGNICIKKAGELIDIDSEIEIRSPLYVGRGAFKLEKALLEFKINPKDLVCLDVGASTGGFTEVLLINGAKKVYAIDVGSDQLAQKLRDDSRVINLEKTNIRDLKTLPEEADLAVMDLSFISITKVFPYVKNLLKKNGVLIVLIKPQFEVGKNDLPKDGVIKDLELRQKVLNETLNSAKENGFQVLQQIDSPIEGKSGNVEYLACLKKL